MLEEVFVKLHVGFCVDIVPNKTTMSSCNRTSQKKRPLIRGKAIILYNTYVIEFIAYRHTTVLYIYHTGFSFLVHWGCFWDCPSSVFFQTVICIIEFLRLPLKWLFIMYSWYPLTSCFLCLYLRLTLTLLSLCSLNHVGWFLCYCSLDHVVNLCHSFHMLGIDHQIIKYVAINTACTGSLKIQLFL